MDPLQPLIDNLLSDGRPRVWSLVITVFGDSVQHRGGRIAAVRLNRLLGRVGIESGALRTALSRLSRDGWVEGRKVGRTSSYSLTKTGQAEFGPATAQIYAPPPERAEEVWTFGTTARPNALKVAGGWLSPGASSGRGFQITGSLGAHSAAEIWDNLDSDHTEALQKMAQDLSALGGLDLPPLEAAAARTLLIHRWRRLVLRFPTVPAELFPASFPVKNLHKAVALTYARLSPSAEQWLDQGEGDMIAMPSASELWEHRFQTAVN